MADVIYNSFFGDVVKGNIDLDTDTIKVMLVTSSYTPNIDTHTKRSDVTNEITGTGYTAGGVTLTSTVVTVDTTNDLAYFDAADAVWATATFTCRGAVMYKSRGGLASADELIKYFDFTADKSPSAAAFTLQFNASGILQFRNYP